jgi:hypothetical protein
MVSDRAVVRPKRLLHLLWTLPVAAMLCALPIALGAINICGVSGCTGGGFGVSYGDELLNWLCAAVVAIVLACAVGAIPWAKPSWVHLGVGAAVGVLAGGLLMAGWLVAKYEYYPAGIDCYPAQSYSECEYE